MGLGLALFPALGGYLFLLTCNTTRPRVQHVPGYHLVFASALAGVFFYAAAFIIAANLDLRNEPFVKTVLTHATMDVHLGTAVSAAALSVLLGLALALVINLRDSGDAANRRAAERAGRLREILLHNAMSGGGLVEISLRKGKSYVALVQKIVVGQPRSSDIVLVPLLSGYRHRDTRDLHITTNYFPILERLRTRGMASDLPVAVPLSEMVSVRPFDLEIWEEFSGFSSE